MSISFSAGAKAEVCRSFPQKHCCALAQCFGILLFCNHFSRDGVRIITESRELAQLLPKLFKKALEVSGCTIDEVVHIGDSIVSDVNNAKSVGLGKVPISPQFP